MKKVQYSMGIAVREKTITSKQFYRFMDAVTELEKGMHQLYWENLYNLAYETGARCIELCRIQLKDIDIYSNKVRIYVAKRVDKEGRPKRLEVRKHVTDGLMENLKKHIEQYEYEIKLSGGNIFFGFNNYKTHLEPSTVRNHVGKARERAGLTDAYALSRKGRKLSRFSFHSIRHLSGQTVCDEYGVFVAQKHLNHSSINSTMHYLDNSEEIQEKIGSVFKVKGMEKELPGERNTQMQQMAEQIKRMNDLMLLMMEQQNLQKFKDINNSEAVLKLQNDALNNRNADFAKKAQN